MTNENPRTDWSINKQGLYFPKYRLTPRSNEELRRIYLEKGFENVKVSDAYDIHGNLLPKMRAIYVKG